MKSKQSGFTLVEIAIVLVIIGLLLGGILKGQELITNAKVRNIADQQSALKAAYFAFQDRFRALPGDYRDAATNIPNSTNAPAANIGNAKIESTETSYAWQHLTNAGFISCSQCSTNPPNNAATADSSNSPVNAFGGVLKLEFDDNYAFINAGGTASTGPANNTNNLKTGSQIPSNMLAEVDRKIDDGKPFTGSFRFSLDGGSTATCVDTSTKEWAIATPIATCGGASTL